jgi:L-lactate utilization protein LutC
MAAQKADQDARKAFIREQVSPSPKVSDPSLDVESLQQIAEAKQKEIVNYDALIANLQRQAEDLLNAVLIRQAKERLEQEIAILEAKRLAELDDEEAILALFF